MTDLPNLDPTDGDNFLSDLDHQMWALSYSTIIRYTCPTIFRYQLGDSRLRVDSSLTFFVPRQHPAAATVIDYLEAELEPLAREGSDMQFIDEPACYAPGLRVSVMPFSGIKPYLTHAEMLPIAEAVMGDLMDSIKASMQGRKEP